MAVNLPMSKSLTNVVVYHKVFITKDYQKGENTQLSLNELIHNLSIDRMGSAHDIGSFQLRHNEINPRQFQSEN